MPQTVKIKGRLYKSFHEEALQIIKPSEAGYAVLYIEGDKSKLFHFESSDNVVESKINVTPPSNLPPDKREEYFEVTFFADSLMHYSTDHGRIIDNDEKSTWKDAPFSEYSPAFRDAHLLNDESVGHPTTDTLKVTVFETNKFNKNMLDKND